MEAIPANPIKWVKRIYSIEDEELKIKCGLDGYFFIRLLRAMILVFLPLMIVITPILLSVNYKGGRGSGLFEVGGHRLASNVTGLDTLSWQNVAPTHTSRYWAHLICAILAISWILFRIYMEKLNFIDVRQRFLTSPEHRLKASARTILITNIPSEYRSKEALEALYDVFVDNDDRSRLTIWVNRDYGALRKLAAQRRKCHLTLEKEELSLLRQVNKRHRNKVERAASESLTDVPSDLPTTSAEQKAYIEDGEQKISAAFQADCQMGTHSSRNDLTYPQMSLVQETSGEWKESSLVGSLFKETKKVPKVAWLRAEIARLTIRIEDLMQKLDDEGLFKKQNSAFIQFDRQMAAHMACSLASHDKPGRMSPRFLEVAPHEVIWPNMDVTSLGRLVRTSIALFLFAAMLFLWGIPTTILASISQLGTLRASVSWLSWLQSWPSWIISLISGK